MPDNKQPLITIITVVLNGAQNLEKSLQSVFKQSFTDYEYIILDGGSTDETLDIINKYDQHITFWLSEPDNGVYDAMNKAVQLAKGQWICFLGADDYLTCEFENVARYLKDRQTIYYGDVYRPVVNRRYDGRFSAYKLASRNICHQSIFYPKSVWGKYAFNLKYQVFADHVLNMCCFSDPDITLQYIPETIAVFHDEGGLSPSTRDETFELDRMMLIREHFPYSVYLMTRVRFGVIHLLDNLGLTESVMKTYHYLLRFVRKVTT